MIKTTATAASPKQRYVLPTLERQWVWRVLTAQIGSFPTTAMPDPKESK
jgi:hypothetical protein